MVRIRLPPAAGPFQRSAADAPSKLYWIQLLLRRRIGSHLRQAALPSGGTMTPVEIDCPLSKTAIQIFSRGDAGVARCPIRENAIRTQMGGTRGSPRDLAPASSRRHPNGHMGHSAASPVADFSALCRLRYRSYVVGSTQHAPGHSVDAAGSHGRGEITRARLSPRAPVSINRSS